MNSILILYIFIYIIYFFHFTFWKNLFWLVLDGVFISLNTLLTALNLPEINLTSRLLAIFKTIPIKLLSMNFLLMRFFNIPW